MVLKLVGIGLGSKKHITLEALEAIKEADEVYVDTYTSPLDKELIEFISESCKGHVVEADRQLLENRMNEVLELARSKKVCIAIPGDPLIATTHSALKTEGKKKDIEVSIIHGVSIYTAAISKSGLHVYKFGRVATIPKTDDVKMVLHAYYILLENLSKGLHTLLLLDTKNGGLHIGDALSLLLKVEEEERRGIVGEESLAIALARIGYEDEKITAASVRALINQSFPPPPHALIIPGELHFTEKDFIMSYSPEHGIVEKHRPANYVKNRIEKYVEKTKRIINALVSSDRIDKKFLEYVDAYVEDSIRFLSSGDYTNALLAIGYAEGLLDALRLIGMVDFKW